MVVWTLRIWTCRMHRLLELLETQGKVMVPDLDPLGEVIGGDAVFCGSQFTTAWMARGAGWREASVRLLPFFLRCGRPFLGMSSASPVSGVVTW